MKFEKLHSNMMANVMSKGKLKLCLELAGLNASNGVQDLSPIVWRERLLAKSPDLSSSESRVFL